MSADEPARDTGKRKRAEEEEEEEGEEEREQREDDEDAEMERRIEQRHGRNQILR